ncbi:MAG: hypothetical protein FWF98_05745 [Dehalococcoidia bacterium]|nr:hypothetical protein [Dehalococcoidia bacterium]
MSNEKSKVTYKQIKKAFTRKDLDRYNALCRELMQLMQGKSKGQLWDMVQPGQRMREVLDELHDIRARYDLLRDEVLFRIWTPNIKDSKMDELVW